MERKGLILWLLIVMTMCIKDGEGNTDMKTPPKISKEFTDTYIFIRSNAVFDCDAEGNPKPTYEWKKNGVVVQSSQFVTVNDITGTIDFKGLQASDYGKYQCFAKNDMGTAMSTVLNLKEAYIDPFSQSKIPQTIGPFDTRTYKKILCEFKGKCQPSQDCTFEWKRGLGTANPIDETDRIAVDREGTLHFLYLELSDASTRLDPISCGQNLETAKSFYKGIPVILNVRKAQDTSSPPVIRFRKKVTGFLHGEATLECIFSGYPIPKITWYKKLPDRQEITSIDGKFSLETYNRKLVIKNLKENDDGIYICKAENDRTSEAEVYLNVTSKPVFKDQAPESLVVPKGDNAVFTCSLRSLEGERDPTAPTWYKNGKKIPLSEIGPGDGFKYQLNTDKTALTVKNVNLGDSCSLMCIVGNVIEFDGEEPRFLETFGGATLRVIEPIEVSVLSERSIEINKPMPISLAVSATTDKIMQAELLYSWKFVKLDNSTEYDNKALEDLPWTIFNGNNNLTIVPENVEADNDDDKVRTVTGTYQVRVYHSYQEKYVKFSVNTNLEPAPVVVVQSAGFDYWIIGVILGVILGVIVLFIVVIFICTLYRNRGGEYLVDKKEVAAGHDPEKELKDSGFADLSRADGEKTPFDRISLSDDVKPLESDEDSMMGDYDDDTMQKFNEDGSFIGAYLDTKKGLLHG